MEPKRIIVCIFLAVLGFSCNEEIEESRRFELLTPEKTGVDFENKIETSDTVNLLTYEYLYNGGGVGVGYFDQDSLPDLIFTSNMQESKLYLNQGGLRFKDVTGTSGINTSNMWATGVSVVDINADGLDDIYIGIGGMGNKNEFPNLLYINQGNATFKESAAEYGLADKGESIQSVFFDYDRDGDLDMYLLTGGGFENSAIQVRPMVTNGQYRNTDRLYRNDFDPESGHPVFTDVSREAGIDFEGFGLGVAILDANNDQWPDIYVSNDYLSRDLLYINRKNGSFTEEALGYFGHTSHFSMGNDVGDIDNDGFQDLITLDMLPEEHKRRKLMSGAHSYEIFQLAERFGYGQQHMRNMLHKNNGDSTYGEIGQMAGVDRTDWSWAPLFADYNNDGANDLFITNGYGKDITDMDFVKYRKNGTASFSNLEQRDRSILDCLKVRPAIKVPNYLYMNKAGVTFEDSSNDWGILQPSISNGAAYADLDLDGDLELVVNNIDQPAFIYRNNTVEFSKEDSNFLQVSLSGRAPNTKAVGAVVTVYSNGIMQKKELQPVRGFESSVDPILHFGLGTHKKIDSITVNWPGGALSVLKEVHANERLHLKEVAAGKYPKAITMDESNKLFRTDSLIRFQHTDKPYNDFAVQTLLNHGFSNQGPGLAVGDVNGDGLQDVFIGGSYGTVSTVFVQNNQGEFSSQVIPETEVYEDLGALFFDANGDGLQDLYVVSGGSERYAGHEAYRDRLYLNNPKQPGTFTLGDLPEKLVSTSVVAGGDYDRDGDIDLFVGGRLVPGSFPESPESYILENQNGRFVDVTGKVCPAIRNAGMITSAVWTDLDQDRYPDLVVVGEFMPVTVLKGNGSTLKNVTKEMGLEHSSGLWNSIIAGDFDNDGDVDLVGGNLGLNTPLKASKEFPLQLKYADFDKNGSVDPIYSIYEEGSYYPFVSLDQLTQQLSAVKKKMLHYRTYAQATTEEVLGLFEAVEAETLSGEIIESSFIENRGEEGFHLIPLPAEVQVAPIMGMLAEDVNNDGLLDLMVVGNEFDTEVVYGKYDAGKGAVLINRGNGAFKVLGSRASDFSAGGNAKSLVRLDLANGQSLVLTGNNNGVIENHRMLNGTYPKKYSFKSTENYATLYFQNGTQRRAEHSFGSGYLSQTSQTILPVKAMDSVQFFDIKGTLLRTEKIN